MYKACWMRFTLNLQTLELEMLPSVQKPLDLFAKYLNFGTKAFKGPKSLAKVVSSTRVHIPEKPWILCAFLSCTRFF